MHIPLLFGPYGSSALEHISRFCQYGANALWFHGFNPDAFEACRRRDIAACVEYKTFRADFTARPELIPMGVDGKPIRYGRLVQGVCLSNTAFLQEVEEELREGLRSFRPRGVWLDYLSYGGWFETPEPDLQESCFCPGCIAEFCDATRIDADTPEAILSHHAQAWTRHKCERVAGFAAHYARMIRQSQPECIIGAYMCPWHPKELDGALGRIFAQDYALLAPWIDVFTPLIYAQKSGRSAEWGSEYLNHTPAFVPPGSKVQLILDALDFPESLNAAARSSVPSWGIQVFAGGRIFGDAGSARLFATAVELIRQGISESGDATRA